MNNEIKEKLQAIYHKSEEDKDYLFEYTFNTNDHFFEEPKTFEEYLDYVEELSDKQLIKILNNLEREII
jgi:hypothetical protein